MHVDEFCNDPLGWGPFHDWEFTPCFQAYFVDPVPTLYIMVIAVFYGRILNKIPPEDSLYQQVITIREPVRFLSGCAIVVLAIMLIVVNATSAEPLYHIYFYCGMDVVSSHITHIAFPLFNSHSPSQSCPDTYLRTHSFPPTRHLILNPQSTVSAESTCPPFPLSL